jgi:hypothetical protein
MLRTTTMFTVYLFRGSRIQLTLLAPDILQAMAGGRQLLEIAVAEWMWRFKHYTTW